VTNDKFKNQNYICIRVLSKIRIIHHAVWKTWVVFSVIAKDILETMKGVSKRKIDTVSSPADILTDSVSIFRSNCIFSVCCCNDIGFRDHALIKTVWTNTF